MKKMLSVLSLGLVLTACGGDNKPVPSTTPTKAEEAPRAGKTYQVVTEKESAPFITRDEYGNTSGFEYELLQAIAEKKGINLQFTAKTWEQMFASLDSGEADIITSNISVTPERQQKYSFTTPHFESGTYAVHKSNARLTNWKDLTDKKVSVQLDTYQQDLASKYSLNYKTYNTPYLALQAVFTGEQDVFIGDKGVAMYFHSQYPDSNIDALPDEAEKDMIAMAVKKGDTELLNTLNDGMKQIRADGTYNKIHVKWFGTEPASTASK